MRPGMVRSVLFIARRFLHFESWHSATKPFQIFDILHYSDQIIKNESTSRIYVE